MRRPCTVCRLEDFALNANEMAKRHHQKMRARLEIADHARDPEYTSQHIELELELEAEEREEEEAEAERAAA